MALSQVGSGYTAQDSDGSVAATKPTGYNKAWGVTRGRFDEWLREVT